MKAYLTIFILTFSMVPVWSQGGITGGLGGIDDKPSRDDNPPSKGHGGVEVSRPDKKSAFEPATTDKQKRERLEKAIEVRKAVLKKRIEAAEKLKKAPAIRRASDAERSIKWMENRLKKMKQQLDIADRESAAEMRDAEDAFNKKWADTAAAIKAGEKPNGMSGDKWARTLDDYEKAKTEMEAQTAYLAWKLKAKREGELKKQEEGIAKVKKTLQSIRDAGKEAPTAVKRLRKALLEHQAHQAHIALMKKRLADYEKILAEVRGQKSSRKDNLMQEVFEKSPYWYVNELGKVIREMDLQWATKPLTKEQQGLSLKPVDKKDPTAADATEKKPEGALPLPLWMQDKPKQKGFSDKDWKKAKVKALAAELAYSNRRLKVLDQAIDAADAIELREYRALLEAKDSQYGSPEAKAKREAKIAKREKDLKDTNAKRKKDERKSLEDHIGYVKKKISKESR